MSTRGTTSWGIGAGAIVAISSSHAAEDVGSWLQDEARQLKEQ